MTRDERRSNTVAAGEFFARSYTRAQIREIRNGPFTPPQLFARWKRDCARARAAHKLASENEVRQRIGLELKPLHKWPTPKEIEEARLDAIGKQINDRMRTPDQRRRAPIPDPAAPHPMLQQNTTTGLHR